MGLKCIPWVMIRRVVGGMAAVLLLTIRYGAAQTAASTTLVPWQQVALLTSEARQAGVTPGGEGGQAIRALVMSMADPNFLMMGTDVGGIYRSLNGGKYWQVCMAGWNARGGDFFAIDPKNPAHVLGIGANGTDVGPTPSPNGLYLSIDKGASWKEVLPRSDTNEWRLDSLAYDPSSYNANKGYCLVAYYASRDGGLFKTRDGGLTWVLVNKDFNSGCIKVHPTRGILYLAVGSGTTQGFYKSVNGGTSFVRISTQPVTCLDVIASRPNNVYLGVGNKVLVSTDSGTTFSDAESEQGLPSNAVLRELRVSPANPAVMACNHGGSQWFQSYTYYSHDGSATWHPTTYDNSLAFLPLTQPGAHFAFHPTNPQLVFGVTADSWIVKSTDGGVRYSWNSNGENAIMLGSSFGFSATSPNTLYLSFQDFDGATTTDGGKTWVWRDPPNNGWGGFEYGGFAVDGNVMWTGDAPSWGGPRTLRVSRDGGKTWPIIKDANGNGLVFAGGDYGYSDPTNTNICFASQYRSADKGITWATMNGCDAVLISNPMGKKELYGHHGNSICRSYDHGVTWTNITPAVPGGLRDIAYDAVRNRLYVASEDHVKQYNLASGLHGTWSTVATPADHYGSTHVWSVAVDPKDPSIVYAGGPANIYATDTTVIRSTDAGAHWLNLTVTTALTSASQPGGPHEVEWLRVHPVTRELWAAGECYGFWKLAAPTK